MKASEFKENQIVPWNADNSGGTPALPDYGKIIKATGTFTEYSAYGVVVKSGSLYSMVDASTLNYLSSQVQTVVVTQQAFDDLAGVFAPNTIYVISG